MERITLEPLGDLEGKINMSWLARRSGLHKSTLKKYIASGADMDKTRRRRQAYENIVRALGEIEIYIDQTYKEYKR